MNPELKTGPLERAFVIAVIFWMGLLAVASIFGGLMSLFTGTASELPKWNGWSYFLFCAKEGAMFGVILTWPAAIVVFLCGWAALRRPR